MKVSALPRSTQLAFAYAVLGLTYVGILVVLINAMWAGSLVRLWGDMKYASSTLLFIAAGLLAHFLVAATLYQRIPKIRVIGAVGAVALFVFATVGAVQILVLSQQGRLPTFAPPEAVWVRLGGALIYGWLAFETIRFIRASNNRMERPREP